MSEIDSINEITSENKNANENPEKEGKIESNYIDKTFPP